MIVAASDVGRLHNLRSERIQLVPTVLRGNAGFDALRRRKRHRHQSVMTPTRVPFFAGRQPNEPLATACDEVMAHGTSRRRGSVADGIPTEDRGNE